METELLNALKVLENGGIIIYPTDTIWGIGCDATNALAVSQIYKLKQRQDTKSMLVLLDSFMNVENYVDNVPAVVYDIVQQSEKPVTIIYPRGKNIAENLINEDGTIGIRVTSDEFCNKLIHRFGKPIVSTSANISGQLYPSNFGEIDTNLLQSVDYVVNLRQDETETPTPSKIVKIMENGLIQIIRD